MSGDPCGQPRSPLPRREPSDPNTPGDRAERHATPRRNPSFLIAIIIGFVISPHRWIAAAPDRETQWRPVPSPRPLPPAASPVPCAGRRLPPGPGSSIPRFPAQRLLSRLATQREGRKDQMAKETLFFVAEPTPSVEAFLPEGLRLVVFRPRPWRPAAHGSRLSLTHAYWLLASFCRYEIWYVQDRDGRMAHYSYVLPKIPTFPFMGRHDLEIGPCVTDDAYRGRGIYPAVLRAIRARRTDARRLWVMAEAENTPSLRGIEKAGFRLVGRGRKRLHFFLLEEPASGP